MRRLVPLAVLPAAAAAVLWRADLPPAPHAVPAAAVFTQAQIHRASDYRGPTYLLALLSLLLPLAVALGLAWRPPAPLLRLRPWLVAAVLAGLLALVVVPFDLVAHVRAQNAGLDLRTTAGWMKDEALAVAVRIVTVALAAAAGLTLLSRLGRAGALFAVGVLVTLFVLVQPVVLDPLLFSTTPVRDPALRADITRLEAIEDAHPRSVTITDAGSRTSGENAAVDGLGPTVRVTLDDTVVNRATPAELRALLGHELAHVARHHTLKGVLWFWVLGLPLLWLVLWLVERFVGHPHSSRGMAAVVAGCLLAWTLALPVQNLISRRYEAEADWAGLRATRHPYGMELLQRRLAIANLANPDPPGWAVWLFFDHPPVMERIAVARAYGSGSS